jgi:hypothetical protein
MGWFRRNHNKIPRELRKEFEQFGEQVVAMLMASPLAGSSGQEPRWKQNAENGLHALAWMREQHRRAVIHEWISMGMEAAILLLVAVEAVPILCRWLHLAC